jgi:modulator of FtsH protease
MQSKTMSTTFEVNKVLRNAFMGVGIELSVYCLAMVIGMTMGISGLMVPMACWVGAMVIIFILPKFADSIMGFGLANIMAGLLGLSSAPAMQYYLGSGMESEVLMAAATTAIITFGLSFYAQVSKKDFSFLGGFLFVAVLGIIVLSLLNIFFFKSSGLSLIMAGVGVVVFSLFILYEVSQVVTQKNGNWIMASVGIFLSIINLFWSLLRIFGAMKD